MPDQPSSDRRRSSDNPKPASREAGGDRRSNIVDQRLFPERRKNDQGSPTGLERRRGAGRRLSDFSKAAEEGEMTTEQYLFLMAIEAFKKANGKTYPSWTDVLEVVRLLGYRKTMPSEVKLRNADDWREAPDAPAQVRPDKWEDRFAA